MRAPFPSPRARWRTPRQVVPALSGSGGGGGMLATVTVASAQRQIQLVAQTARTHRMATEAIAAPHGLQPWRL